MATCRYCGARLFQGAPFCWKCGKDTKARLCPSCGAELDDDSVFCDMCGARVGESEAAPADAAEARGEEENRNLENAGALPQDDAGIDTSAAESASEEGAAVCANCGAKIKPGDIFCKACGSRIEGREDEAVDVGGDYKFCPGCGARLPKVAAFCGECGKTLSKAGAEADVEDYGSGRAAAPDFSGGRSAGNPYAGGQTKAASDTQDSGKRGASTAGAGKAQRSGSKKKFILIGAAAAAVLAVLILVFAVISKAKDNKIYFSDYMEVTFSGKNGEGSASYSIDRDKLIDDATAALAKKTGKSYEVCIWATTFWIVSPTVSFDKEDGLSNGDVVTVTLTEDDTFNEMYGDYVEVVGGTKKIKVTGLE